MGPRCLLNTHRSAYGYTFEWGDHFWYHPMCQGNSDKCFHADHRLCMDDPPLNIDTQNTIVIGEV